MRALVVGAAVASFVGAFAAQAQLAPLVTPQDYPPGALERNERGTVSYRLTIGTNGRVKDCRVTLSSGSSELDNATCKIMRARARFKPAVDRDGFPIESNYDDKLVWSAE